MTIFQTAVYSTHIQLTILSPLIQLKVKIRVHWFNLKGVFGTTNNRKQEFDFFDKNIINLENKESKKMLIHHFLI
jgi:hypothetical protein